MEDARAGSIPREAAERTEADCDCVTEHRLARRAAASKGARIAYVCCLPAREGEARGEGNHGLKPSRTVSRG